MYFDFHLSDFGIYSMLSNKTLSYLVQIQHVGWKTSFTITPGTKWGGLKSKAVCVFVWLVVDLQLEASIPKRPCPHCETLAGLRTKVYTHTHTLKSYLANLQCRGSPDCLFSKVQLESFQSTIEHIPTLFSLLSYQDISPDSEPVAGGREKNCIWIMNSHLSPFSLPSKVYEPPQGYIYSPHCVHY